MTDAELLGLVKYRLGFTTTVRDEYLTARIAAVKKELEDDKGIRLDTVNNVRHALFVVDFTEWKYKSVDANANKMGSVGAMPRFLQLELHEMMIHSGGSDPDVVG